MPEIFIYKVRKLLGDWEERIAILPRKRKRGGVSPPCQACGGRGYIVRTRCNNTEYSSTETECQRCCGTGHEIREGDL